LKIGIATFLFSDMPPEKMLKHVSGLGYEAVEIQTKDYNDFDNWRPGPHLDIDKVLSGGAAEYKRLVQKYGLIISALGDHERWQLGPNKEKQKQSNRYFRRAIQAAQALDVPVVVGFTGCPDWSAWFSWPSTNIEKWEQGWTEFRQVWGENADFAAKHDVKIAIEVHPQNMAYNLETAVRMNKEVPSKALGINFDPCEYVWQRIDPVMAIHTHASRIYHCHSKDIEVNEPYLARSGITSTGTWDRMDRGFTYRCAGWGDMNWKKMITAFLQVRYDYVLSYEHEDPVMSPEDGAEKAIQFLKPLIIKKPIKKIWW
jgi:sugar phosphate isomerase/epimerase